MSDLLEFFKMDTNKIPVNEINWNNMCAIPLHTHYKESNLDNDDIDVLLDVYQIMFPV